MSRVVLADTGPLYAAVDSDDLHHLRAQRELRRLKRDGSEVLLAYPTLSEAYTLVLYRLGRGTSLRWLGEIAKGVSLVNPAPEDYHDAASLLRKFSDQPISLFDATLAVLSRRLGAEVWTYDHHFDLMGSNVWR